MKKLAIYIHIPFCLSKCKYCDFASAPADSRLKDEYVNALINEISEFNSADFTVDTVYIGGGTPSTLKDGALFNIISTLKSKFKYDIIEFSVECNPNSLNSNKLREYAACGVTRISLGAQSLNDEILSIIGRSHNREQVIKALESLKRSKFDFSVDLMIGLPKQTTADVIKDIDEIMKYGAGHISCYSLIVEEGTPIAEMVKRGEMKLPSDDETVDTYNAVHDRLKRYGLERYEISNFGKPCLHNLGYWTLHNYAGFGVSAHSLVGNVRYYNVSDTREYIRLYGDKSNNMDNNNYIIEEALTDSDRADELIMLGLRTDKGVSLADLAECGQEYLIQTLEKAEKLKEYLTISETYIAIKPEFIYISNGIIEKMMVW